MDLNLQLALSSVATAAGAGGDPAEVYSPTRAIYDPTPYLEDLDSTVLEEPYDPLSPAPPFDPVQSAPLVPPYDPSEPAFIDLDADDSSPIYPRQRRRWRSRRRFRSSLPTPNYRSFDSLPPSPGSVNLFHSIMSSHRSLGNNNNNKHGSVTKVIDVEETEEEKKGNVANFECNVCLEMAKEPVVTCCGHLFCWPCLYQWLNFHSEHKECPVCKGEVLEGNVIPIYGRGISVNDSKEGKEVDMGSKVPPRPHGNRRDSIRQQFLPLHASIDERWQRFINERNSSGIGHSDSFGPRHPGTLNMWRQMVMLSREERNADTGPNVVDVGSSGDSLLNRYMDVNLPIPDGYDIWRGFSLYGIAADRLANLTADIGRMVGRFSSSRSSLYSPAASSSNSMDPSPQAAGWFSAANGMGGDQASASSTMAMIEGDVAVTGVSADPTSAGSSRPIRRRGRSSTSGSLDVDGGDLHPCKRRRLN